MGRRKASAAPSYHDDIDAWSGMAYNLCKLKEAAEKAKEFSKGFAKYLSAEERVDLAKMHSKFDVIYWKHWEGLIRKIRGIC